MSCFGGCFQILCVIGAMLCPQALNKSTFVKAIGQYTEKVYIGCFQHGVNGGVFHESKMLGTE